MDNKFIIIITNHQCSKEIQIISKTLYDFQLFKTNYIAYRKSLYYKNL